MESHGRFAYEPTPPRGPELARLESPGSWLLLGSLLLLVGCSDQLSARASDERLPAVGARRSEPDRVSALGRLEPEDGLIRVAGPSGTTAVIGQLFVDDMVRRGGQCVQAVPPDAGYHQQQCGHHGETANQLCFDVHFHIATSSVFLYVVCFFERLGKKNG